MPDPGSEPYEGNVYRVKLVSQTTAREGLSEQERVIFDVTPDLSESRKVNYSSVDPVHMPGQIYVYKNTAARNFSLSSVKLISRTQEEAEKNLTYLWLLRGWMMPRFGAGSSTLSPYQKSRRDRVRSNPGNYSTEQQQEQLKLHQTNGMLGTELLGAPPPVLLLSAYSKGFGQMTNADGAAQELSRQHINNVPVVMESLSIPYPSDVDYIKSTSGVPMPTIMSIDLSLLETHSAGEYERFSLDQYKTGTLPGF